MQSLFGPYVSPDGRLRWRRRYPLLIRPLPTARVAIFGPIKRTARGCSATRLLSCRARLLFLFTFFPFLASICLMRSSEYSIEFSKVEMTEWVDPTDEVLPGKGTLPHCPWSRDPPRRRTVRASACRCRELGDDNSGMTFESTLAKRLFLKQPESSTAPSPPINDFVQGSERPHALPVLHFRLRCDMQQR